MARLARARQHLERQQRLGYPDAKRKLKMLAVTEARARDGELTEPPKPVATAPQISEEQIRRACHGLSICGRSERRGPFRRKL